MKNYREQKDDGFTIIELVLVCVIIGVLSAAAIPFFGSQRENAVEATLVSDVRNAAMEMEKEAIFSENGYAPDIPATFFESDGNIIVIDSSVSSEHSYCIIGTSTQYEDLFYYYHSDNRIVTKDMKTCGFTPVEEMGPLPLSPANITPEPTPVLTPTPTPEPTSTPTSTPTPVPTATVPAIPTPKPSPTVTTPAPTPTPAPIVKPAKKTAPAPVGYDDPKKKKYKICHNTGQALELPLPAILNGHSGHPTDIIPAIPGQYTGQNWTIEGAAIWKNNCSGMKTIDYMG
ncbi:MAG: type II secretion system protein [Enterococcus sp.]|nr:type II secretion system protein [Enterococcus sp.]